MTPAAGSVTVVCRVRFFDSHARAAFMATAPPRLADAYGDRFALRPTATDLASVVEVRVTFVDADATAAEDHVERSVLGILRGFSITGGVVACTAE
jgi:hypothetical protein